MIEPLQAGTELKGKRVSVQVDGGRTKIRWDLRELQEIRSSPQDKAQPEGESPGRSRQTPKRTIDADWREPKVATIFVHNVYGKMDKKLLATLDDTFEGTDALAELIAMHLHRLGAAAAKSITFAADGGVCNWERIPAIVRPAKLERVPQHEFLACYHATHYISLPPAALGLNETTCKPLYKESRTTLRNGKWRQVVDELTDLAQDEPEDSKVWTEINYLRKHGDAGLSAGRLEYPTFRGLGLPLGSGAIVSSMRRVVTTRVKGNAIFWRQETAEAILQLRPQVVNNRWDERKNNLRQTDTRTDWSWEPTVMTSKAEPETPKSA